MAPDQIVIHLKNHGGPGKSGNNTSCIMLNHTQSLCDEELGIILKKVNPGVKVAIIVSGCFSGGFAKLASQSVCVATTTDQDMYALGDIEGQKSLWTLLKNGDLTTFENISNPNLYGGRIKYRTAAGTMKIESCFDVMDRVQKRLWSTFNIDLYRGLEKAIEPYCGVRNLTSFYPEQLLAFSVQNKIIPHIFSHQVVQIICEELGPDPRGREICDGWRKLANKMGAPEIIMARLNADKAANDLHKVGSV